jgi:hypothetical protein
MAYQPNDFHISETQLISATSIPSDNHDSQLRQKSELEMAESAEVNGNITCRYVP